MSVVIKCSVRGNSAENAAHLGNEHDNEEIRFIGTSEDIMAYERLDFLPSERLRLIGNQYDVKAAVHSKDDKHIFNISINPTEKWTDEQYAYAWQIYSKEFGLDHNSHGEVEHLKKGRTHRHRTYYALDEKGNYLNIRNNYMRNEKIARILEYVFNEEMTVGRHNRAVYDWLINGKDEWLDKDLARKVAERMEREGLLSAKRPNAKQKDYEAQTGERTGIDPATIKEYVLHAYNHSDTQRAFEQALAEKNIHLAQGDRVSKRGNAGRYVIIDPAGVVMALHRCEINIKEFEAKFLDLKYDYLPKASAVQKHLAEQRKEKETTKSGAGGEGGLSPEEEYKSPKKRHQELSALINQDWGNLKQFNQKLKRLDIHYSNEIHNLWQDYHKEKAPLQAKIDKKYEKQKAKIKKKYKLKWKNLFRKREADLYRARANELNLPQKIILAFQYRREICAEYGRKDFFKYMKFMYQQHRAVQLVEKRFQQDKATLFERQKIDYAKARKKIKDKSKEQPKIDALLKDYKKKGDQLHKEQQNARATNKELFTQQKILDKQKRDALNLQIKLDIAKYKSGKYRPPIGKFDPSKHSTGRNRENENER